MNDNMELTGYEWQRWRRWKDAGTNFPEFLENVRVDRIFRECKKYERLISEDEMMHRGLKRVPRGRVLEGTPEARRILDGKA